MLRVFSFSEALCISAAFSAASSASHRGSSELHLDTVASAQRLFDSSWGFQTKGNSSFSGMHTIFILYTLIIHLEHMTYFNT